jgi:hypothetical protein
MTPERKPWFIRKRSGFGYSGVRWPGALVIAAVVLGVVAICYLRGPV